jgi:hypothetical protein
MAVWQSEVCFVDKQLKKINILALCPNSIVGVAHCNRRTIFNKKAVPPIIHFVPKMAG